MGIATAIANAIAAFFSWLCSPSRQRAAEKAEAQAREAEIQKCTDAITQGDEAAVNKRLQNLTQGRGPE